MTQLGAAGSPLTAARPCSDARFCAATSSWQRPQASICASGSTGAITAWPWWQSMQFAAGLPSTRRACGLRAISLGACGWQRLQRSSTTVECSGDAGSTDLRTSWVPWQLVQAAAGEAGSRAHLPCGPPASSAAMSSWQLAQSTGCSSSACGSSAPSSSAWQSMQAKLPCTELSKALASTCTANCRPPRCPTSSGSSWQLRQSALLWAAEGAATKSAATTRTAAPRHRSGSLPAIDPLRSAIRDPPDP